MNWEACIKQQEAEARRLERLGWTPIPGIPQEQIATSKGKYPQGSKYHWTSQTVLVPPSKDAMR